MSQLLILAYQNQIRDLISASGEVRESIVSEAFKDLLKGWGRQHDLIFLAQYGLKENRKVDGALVHTLRVPFGYWEAKDQDDDIDREIQKKLRVGYPQDNIIFENSRTAVLIQHGEESFRCEMDDIHELEKLLKLFFGFERPEIANFNRALRQFKTDLPAVLGALRTMIATAYQDNGDFHAAADNFLEVAKATINPSFSADDVREMLIQHILTEDIFSKVFGEDDFHRNNNVAQHLYALESKFFVGHVKKATLKALAPYYGALQSAAANISLHSEKQAFLKVIYENFYKVYNPKAADRLGVVYTPNEIVRFMIDGADWLCEKHFGRHLVDRDVEILDPATGTGTFICELLEHFRGQPEKLKFKYEHELHANEVAILPYYVANLNIEATYAALTNQYQEFKNLCFVDTLDNTSALRKVRGYQEDLFGGMGAENVGRIKRQNARRISVVIGNPPYNANQMNENENNKNRIYTEIDKRIKETYIKESTAQKTKEYDMYKRFIRWASDRVDENGIVAFITPRKYVNSRTSDGFRKVVCSEFSDIYVIDLGGDVRENPKLSGTKHNVFGIQTGVAISFFVKQAKAKTCRVYYARRPEDETAESKLSFLVKPNSALEVPFVQIHPDARHNWINQAENDFEALIPLAAKDVKTTVRHSQEKAVFKLYSLGVSTNRDEWVYDVDQDHLSKKVKELCQRYAAQLPGKEYAGSIKWSRNLKRRYMQGRKEPFDRSRIITAIYRPYHKRYLYDSDLFVDERGAADEMFPHGLENTSIVMTDPTAQKPWLVCATKCTPDLHYVGAAAGAVCLPLTRTVDGVSASNITGWAGVMFKKHYAARNAKARSAITGRAIFHYCYAVLHDPVYREQYAKNLKREYPRIPLYPDFCLWSRWGKALMDLHVGYESAAPFKLKRTDVPDQRARDTGTALKVVLKADKEAGEIVLDSETTLAGIPAEAWLYQLGNRSALEWVLDQYKEKKIKDPTVREKFNTYRFADYKEQVIDLLRRITTVSVETVRITNEMKTAAR